MKFCHSEAEARTKWCPFARSITSVVVPSGNSMAIASANRSKNGQEWPETSNCIASNCMAWRWMWASGRISKFMPSDDPHGYCGLAGPPPER